MNTLIRAMLAAANSKIHPHDTARNFVARAWGSHAALEVETLLRAATTPATLGDPAWAGLLGGTSYAYLRALSKYRAGGATLSEAIQLAYAGAATITLPTLAPGTCGFVGENQPIPVEQMTSSAPVLGAPRKLACLTEVTSELLMSSNADVMLHNMLLEAASLGLDGILFDLLPGDATRPAGLRYNVPASPASSAADKLTAMHDDVIMLGAAVGAVAAGPLLFIANVAQALALNVRNLGAFAYQVLPTDVLPAGTVICLAPSALVVAFDGPPEILASKQAVLHRSDAPSEIVNGVPATPVGSIFQTDSCALRLIWLMNWQLRGPAISWTESVTW
jgi:hypothetical protein